MFSLVKLIYNYNIIGLVRVAYLRRILLETFSWTWWRSGRLGQRSALSWELPVKLVREIIFCDKTVTVWTYSTFLKLYLCHCIDKTEEGKRRQGWCESKNYIPKGEKKKKKTRRKVSIHLVFGFLWTTRIISLGNIFHDFEKNTWLLLSEKVSCIFS